MNRRSFVALLAAALALPGAIWQRRRPGVHTLTDATITTPAGVVKLDDHLTMVTGVAKVPLHAGDFLAVDGGELIRAAKDDTVIGVALEDVQSDQVKVLLTGVFHA